MTTLPTGKKSTQAVTEQTREVQQVAVNLERKRVIIHLEKGSKSVCHSPGSTKLSQAPAGGENRVKHFSVVCGQGSAIYSHSHAQYVICSIRQRLEMSSMCSKSRQHFPTMLSTIQILQCLKSDFKQMSGPLVYFCFRRKNYQILTILQLNSFSKLGVIFTLEACRGGTMCLCVRMWAPSRSTTDNHSALCQQSLQFTGKLQGLVHSFLILCTH